MSDHTEAMRLADHAMALSNEGPMIHAVSWTQINGTLELCANTIRQKSARIAELEARVHTCGPTCSKAGCINRRLTAERDTLRAEVERLKREKAHAIDKAGHMLAAGMGLSNCAFNLKQRVGEPLSTHDVAALESSQRAWDTAIDTARKATP